MSKERRNLAPDEPAASEDTIFITWNSFYDIFMHIYLAHCAKYMAMFFPESDFGAIRVAGRTFS